jgi:NADPH:quinone reductase
MRAAWYERKGAAADVLVVGDMPDPEPGSGEVRVRVYASGVNPGDVKRRQGWLGYPMPYPRVIPHSDGAGVIDAVGEGVEPGRVGQRVWIFGAQTYRPFGTAAELVVVPGRQAVRLPDSCRCEVGACLGIPGITAHRAVFADGPVQGEIVLVAGAAGAVGSLATSFAAEGAAEVLAIGRNREQADAARMAGARHVVIAGPMAAATIRAIAPHGVNRIIEVSLSENARLDCDVIAQGGTIAAYGTLDDEPRLPFWPLLFANVTLQLLGSDDFPEWAVDRAVAEISDLLAAGMLEPAIGARFALDDIAQAHDAVETSSVQGRVVVEFCSEPVPPTAPGRVAPV